MLEQTVSGIAGIVSLKGVLADDKAQSFLKHLDRGSGSSIKVVRSRKATFALLKILTRGQPAACSDVHADADFLGLADARLTNRIELGAMLSLSPEQIAATDDGTLLIRLYRRFGARGIARGLGAFAFAAWDETAQRLTLGRDCLGERTLFFHLGNGFVAFASDLNTLLSLPFLPRTLDEDALANYLALNLGRPSQTFYKHIERVPNRTLVTVDPSGLRRDSYWSPDLAAPPPFKKEEDYIERARELFDQAVMRTTQDTPQIAISTSGGLELERGRRHGRPAWRGAKHYVLHSGSTSKLLAQVWAKKLPQRARQGRSAGADVSGPEYTVL